MIKVNKTILHNNTPVAEGKLVLIDVCTGNIEVDIKNSIVHIRAGQGMVNCYNPVIISKTERVQDEECYGYNISTKKLVKCDKDYYNPWTYKVLCMPENFSPQHIKNISHNKLKNGACIFLECGKIEWSMQIDPTTVGQTHIKLTDISKDGNSKQYINIINIPVIIKQEDWDDVFNAYDKAGIKTTLGMEKFLKSNYNPPTRK